MSRVVVGMLVLALQTAISGQTLVVLHIRVALIDATGQATPVPRHALLISENPPTREPRRILMSVDGTADVKLGPGNTRWSRISRLRFWERRITGRKPWTSSRAVTRPSN